MSTAPTRICRDCGIPKPLTTVHFPVKNGTAGRYLMRQCRECRRKQDRKAAADLRAGIEPKKSTPGTMKLCASCGNLPWRVVGPRCRECKLLYRDEAPAELMFRKFYEAV